MSQVNIVGYIQKIFVNTKGFLIAKINRIDDDQYQFVNFKGNTFDDIKVNDKVSVSGTISLHPTFGVQLEGSLYLAKSKKTEKNSNVFSLTDEQNDIVTKAKAGNTLKIKAFAGTGKTATLVEIAKQMPARGLYLAYNKSIQVDAQTKFPEHVVCKTSHSLAYGHMYNEINGRVKSSITPTEFMHYIDVSSRGNYSSFEISFLAIKVLRLFCISWHKEIGDHFFDDKEFSMLGDEEDQKAVVRYICILAEEYWSKCVSDMSLPLEHDFYLKMFQLKYINLSKRFDYIMLDEAQDASPVLLNIVGRQTTQKIYVGDAHQQIYAWRGAINAMNFLDGEEAYLTQSFRFGKEVADKANILLKFLYEKETLLGNENIDSKIVTKKPKKLTILSRTNAKLILNLVDNINKKIHVIGGVDEVLVMAKSGFALYQGRKEDVKHSKLRYFHSWGALIKFNENFNDPDIGFLVKILDKYGDKFDEIIRKIECANYVHESQASIVLSTIHKAKGREWDNVLLDGDFPMFLECECLKEALRQSKEEFNLLYVGVTRAKKQLMLAKGVDSFLKRIEKYITPTTSVQTPE